MGGHECRRLKTVAKSAKDNFKATADRCASIRDSIEAAEEEINAVNAQLYQNRYDTLRACDEWSLLRSTKTTFAENSAKKDAAFVKALQTQLAALDSLPGPTINAKQVLTNTSPSANLKSAATQLLALCASLEIRYLSATNTITEAQSRVQDRINVGVTWSDDQACLINTIKAGARVVDRRIKSLTDEEIEKKVRMGGRSEEELRTLVSLGLDKLLDVKAGSVVGVHEVIMDASAGLRKMTRRLPVEIGGEDVDMVM